MPHQPARRIAGCRARGGFTVAEFLPVLLIVGIVMAIAIPAWIYAGRHPNTAVADAAAMGRQATALAAKAGRGAGYSAVADPRSLGGYPYVQAAQDGGQVVFLAPVATLGQGHHQVTGPAFEVIARGAGTVDDAACWVAGTAPGHRGLVVAIAPATACPLRLLARRS